MKRALAVPPFHSGPDFGTGGDALQAFKRRTEVHVDGEAQAPPIVCVAFSVDLETLFRGGEGLSVSDDLHAAAVCAAGDREHRLPNVAEEAIRSARVVDLLERHIHREDSGHEIE